MQFQFFNAYLYEFNSWSKLRIIVFRDTFYRITRIPFFSATFHPFNNLIFVQINAYEEAYWQFIESTCQNHVTSSKSGNIDKCRLIARNRFQSLAGMRNLKRVATYRNKINKQTHCASANRADKQRPPTLSPPPFHDFVFFLLSCFFPLSLVAFSTIQYFSKLRNLRGISIFETFHPSSGWKFWKIGLFNYSAIYL